MSCVISNNFFINPISNMPKIEYFDKYLKNLLNNEWRPLTDLNPAIAKKFFEYAIENEEYKKKLSGTDLNTNTGLFFNYFNHELKRLIVTAAVVSLKKNVEYFKKFYVEYLNQKLRGDYANVSELYEFNCEIFTYLSWANEFETLKWVYDMLKHVYFEQLRTNDNCRNWIYLRNVRYLDSMNNFLVETSVILKSNEMFKVLVSSKIFQRSKHIRLVKKLKCDVKKGELITAPFLESNEWKFISKDDTADITKIELKNLMKIIKESSSDKQFISKYFLSDHVEPIELFKFMSEMTNTELTFVTSRQISYLLYYDKFSTFVSKLDSELIKKIIIKLFEHRNVSIELVKRFKRIAHTVKYSSKDAIDFVFKYFNRKIVIHDYSRNWYVKDFKEKMNCLLNVSKINDNISKKDDSKLVISNANEVCLFYEVLPKLTRSIKQYVEYKHAAHSNDDVTCPICLEEFSDSDEKVLSLICNHKIHASCMNDYMKTMASNSIKCCVCRTPVHINSLLD